MVYTVNKNTQLGETFDPSLPPSSQFLKQRFFRVDYWAVGRRLITSALFNDAVCTFAFES